MSHRRQWLFALACLFLAGSLGWLLNTPNRPSLHLRITRKAFEQGRTLVFFKIDGGETNSYSIGQVSKIGPIKTQNAWLAIEDNIVPEPDFWAPAQRDIHFEDIQKEFGVLAPTDSGIWKLQVEVLAPNRYSIERLTALSTFWQISPKQWAEAMSMRWNFPYTRKELIQSEPITNTVLGSSLNLKN